MIVRQYIVVVVAGEEWVVVAVGKEWVVVVVQ